MSRWLTSRPGPAQPPLAELLRSGDRDALAGFYDARAGYVRAYGAATCPDANPDDVTLAAFVDFLARADRAASDDDLDLLLVKATRSAAAGRMAVDASDPICRAMPEVLSARANGEHIHDERPFEAHLDECPTCRDTARRLLDAEQTLKGEPGADPGPAVLDTWLSIAEHRNDGA